MTENTRYLARGEKMGDIPITKCTELLIFLVFSHGLMMAL
jgi:hypothetical protein